MGTTRSGDKLAVSMCTERRERARERERQRDTEKERKREREKRERPFQKDLEDHISSLHGLTNLCNDGNIPYRSACSRPYDSNPKL